MTPRALARKIATLRAHLPLTAAFEHALEKKGIRDHGSKNYPSQKQHWMGYLNDYPGPGFYGRKKKGHSARFAYGCIRCSPMVLWLGEAAGLPKSKVLVAKKAALSRGTSMAKQCKIIRQFIPWEDIEANLFRKRSS